MPSKEDFPTQGCSLWQDALYQPKNENQNQNENAHLRLKNMTKNKKQKDNTLTYLSHFSKSESRQVQPK